MLKSRYLPLLAILSFSAFAEVSFDEKKNRIEYLEGLAKEATSMNIDAYRRELQYEKQNLPLEQRAKKEANIISQKIQRQVFLSYEAALENKTPEEATQEVKKAIDKDLELVSPELQNELRELSYGALENARKGITNTEIDLFEIEQSMLNAVQDRAAYLNEEGEDIPHFAFTTETYNPSQSSADINKSSAKKIYAKKSDVIEALISDGESARWVQTSHIALRGDDIFKTEEKVKIQLKVEFLGVEVEAGPTIFFKREFRTVVNINAEGLNPILLPDGNFDFMKRDRGGEVVVSNGKDQKRFVNFYCDAALEFESEYAGGGGFSVGGLGTSTSIAKVYRNTVTLTSRRISVPEYIDNQSVTIKYLSQLCHKDFLNAKITNTMDVAGSLNMMMRSTLAGLRFSHPKTKCLTDNHCNKWFNARMKSLRVNNVVRCVEDDRDKLRTCEIRGSRGQNCSVFDVKGKRVSDGNSEYTCDTGLRCVKVQEEGWLKGWSFYQYAQGKCLP